MKAPTPMTPLVGLLLVVGVLGGCVIIPTPSPSARRLVDVWGQTVTLIQEDGELNVRLGHDRSGPDRACPVWDAAEEVSVTVGGARFDNVTTGGETPPLHYLGGFPPQAGTACPPGPTWVGPVPDDARFDVVIEGEGLSTTVMVLDRDPPLPAAPRVIATAPEAALEALGDAWEAERRVLYRGLSYQLVFDDHAALLDESAATEVKPSIGNLLFGVFVDDDNNAPDRAVLGACDVDECIGGRFYDGWSNDIWRGSRPGVLDVKLQADTPILQGLPFIDADEGVTATYTDRDWEKTTTFEIEVVIEDGPSFEEGTWLGPCFANETCFDALKCVQGICQNNEA